MIRFRDKTPEGMVMNKKIFAIIKREFWTRAKTKGFIIGTLMFPVMITFFLGGYFVFSLMIKPESQRFYVIDQTGIIFNEFAQSLSDTLKSGEPKYQFTQQFVDSDSTKMDSSQASYQQLIRDKKIDGYLIIPKDLIDSHIVHYAARNVSDWDIFQDMERSLSRIITNQRLAKKGLSADEIRHEMSQGWVRLQTRQVTEKGEIEKSSLSSFGLTYFLGYMLFLMIMIYGQMLLRSVIEEKTQRITETIISSIKPIELMLGKIVGICALGLTQIIVVGLMVSGTLSILEPLFRYFGITDVGLLNFIGQINFSPTVFFFLVTFFFLGFVFYASMYAALGAMVTTEDEGQQMQTPIIFTLIAGFMMMIPIIKNPESATSLWISLIPFFTPTVMFARVSVSDPLMPSGAIFSIFTMLAATVIMVWFIAKIYRVGILMYGKKATFKEALRWIRYK